MARLGDYVRIRTGKLDANASSEKGQYPFFTCAIEPLRIDSYSYDCECVLVAGNGDLNVKYYNGKFDACMISSFAFRYFFSSSLISASATGFIKSLLLCIHYNKLIIDSQERKCAVFICFHQGLKRLI